MGIWGDYWQSEEKKHTTFDQLTKRFLVILKQGLSAKDITMYNVINKLQKSRLRNQHAKPQTLLDAYLGHDQSSWVLLNAVLPIYPLTSSE